MPQQQASRGSVSSERREAWADVRQLLLEPRVSRASGSELPKFRGELGSTVGLLQEVVSGASRNGSHRRIPK